MREHEPTSPGLPRRETSLVCRQVDLGGLVAVFVGRLGEDEIGTGRERADVPTRAGVGRVDHALAVATDLDREGGWRVIRAREAELDVVDGDALTLVDRGPGKRSTPVAADELTEMLGQTRGRVDGESLALEAVAREDMQPVHIDAVVGMLVGDDDRGEILRLDVLLEVPERPVAAVHPDVRVPRLDEVAAARAPVRSAVGA